MRLLTARQHEALVAEATKAGMFSEALARAAQEIKRLLSEVASEKARADRAVDALLAVRGFPTVTPREGMPEIPDSLAEDPEKIAEVEKRMQQGDASVFTERF